MSKKPQPVSFNVIWPACIQCGACVAVCLQREPFISAFDTIAIDTPCHIACMRCVEVCPTSAITYCELYLTPERSPATHSLRSERQIGRGETA